jgi:glycosyltransferase involved in cell wall biosynthesis
MLVNQFEHRPLLSVIVPAYNEERAVGQVLQKLTALQREISMEIIVVDDGSVDRTLEEVKEFPSVRIAYHNKNMGKGRAIVTGLSESRGKIIVIQDADGEYPPEEIPKIISPIVKKQADIVFGSRFMCATAGYGMSVSHRFGNVILSLAASLLYNVRITDIMTGHKAFSKEAIDSIGLFADGFEIEVEMTGRLLSNGWRFIEVPIPYLKRKIGVAKITARDGFICLAKLFFGRFY